MLTPLQRDAVGLLFEGTLEEAAAKLTVNPEQIRQWLQEPAFRKALDARSEEKRQSARRIAVQAALLAAQALEAAAQTGDEKGFCKTSVDILKAAGAFTERSEAESAEDGDQCSSLDKLIRLAGAAEEGSCETVRPLCGEE